MSTVHAAVVISVTVSKVKGAEAKHLRQTCESDDISYIFVGSICCMC